MSDPRTYTVGWICAIDKEFVAATAFLDESHDDPDQVSTHDNNAYRLGRMGKHNVVIGVAPDGEYGTQSAANVARDMMHSFPNVRIGLMVGIGGGVPSAKHDVRLGDVVVSAPRDGKGGVFQYDFGQKRQSQNFQPTGFLNQPPPLLRTAVAALRAEYESEGHQLEEAVADVLDKKPRLRKRGYARPQADTDRLYMPTIIHPPDAESDCTGTCGQAATDLIVRTPRTEDDDDPMIHYGLIASGNQVMRDATIRDTAAQQGVLCFEMEAAGLMNHFPCLVVRGICDYSDSHKNKKWQGYAAMVAAAYAKALLNRIAPNKIELEKPIVQSLSEIQRDVDTVRKGVGEILLKHHREDEYIVLQWLTSTEYKSQQHDFISRRQPGTGQWLLDSDEFQTWQKSTNHTLFCHGIPGAGKTVLSSVVVDNLCRKRSTDTHLSIAYIYCSFQQRGQQGTQKVEDILASLTRQLAQSYLPLPTQIIESYRTHSKAGTRPTRTDYVELLSSLIAMSPKTFIVLDGLDELSDDCRSKLLAELFRVQTKVSLNIFLTSRPSIDIEKELQECTSYGTLEIRARDQDLEAYLENRVSELRVSISTEFWAEIKRTISEVADGMFLLAQLLFGMLQDQTTKSKIRVTLERFRPKNEREFNEASKLDALNDAYQDTLMRINAQSPGLRGLANQALCWIVCAERPLVSAELRTGLAVIIGESQFDAENLPDVSTVISVCHGLVTIDKNSQVIRLVHYTTQEYFDQHQHLLQSTQIPDPQAYLAESCTTYLSLDVPPTDAYLEVNAFRNPRDRYPLFAYARQYWGVHMRKASEKCQHQIPGFLIRKGLIDEAIKLPFRSRFTYSSKLPQMPRTGIHLAAYFGLSGMIKAVLVKKPPLDEIDILTPLSWASKNGHEDTVRLLADNGAGLDIIDGDGSTALLLASAKGDEAVVRILVEQGATVDLADKNGGTPLLKASESGYEKVVKLLIDNGANMSVTDADGRTLLSKASEKGHLEVVRVLIDNGAVVDLADKSFVDSRLTAYNGTTPLWQASSNGHEEVAQLLIERGAQVDVAEQIRGITPLMEASSGGYEKVVRLLVENGAAVNWVAKDDTTPLWQASDHGHNIVAQFLIQSGANVDPVDRVCRATPLSRAACSGRESTVQILIENGANIESMDVHGTTPLWLALRHGHLGTARILVEKGANVNLANDKGLTPLMWASYYGWLTTVQILIEHGAITHPGDDYDMAPILLASLSGHKQIVRLLIEKGADVNWADSCNQTPLLCASIHGHEETARFLIQEGAAVGAADNCGRTPLLLAAKCGHEKVVRLLIENEANVNIADNQGQTPLDAARESRDDLVVNMLEKTGPARRAIVKLLEESGAVSGLTQNEDE